jgi:hypothetical protein
VLFATEVLVCGKRYSLILVRLELVKKGQIICFQNFRVVCGIENFVRSVLELLFTFPVI